MNLSLSPLLSLVCLHNHESNISKEDVWCLLFAFLCCHCQRCLLLYIYIESYFQTLCSEIERHAPTRCIYIDHTHRVPRASNTVLLVDCWYCVIQDTFTIWVNWPCTNMHRMTWTILLVVVITWTLNYKGFGKLYVLSHTIMNIVIAGCWYCAH